jgi:hypothetical protein
MSQMSVNLLGIDLMARQRVALMRLRRARARHPPFPQGELA